MDKFQFDELVWRLRDEAGMSAADAQQAAIDALVKDGGFDSIRGSRYGPFKGHAEITQGLKLVMHESGGWSALTDSQREALEMIAHKIGRMLNGDPTYLDNAVDIVGYAQLMLDDMTAVDSIMREMEKISQDECKD